MLMPSVLTLTLKFLFAAHVNTAIKRVIPLIVERRLVHVHSS